ncbi:MAG TPA: hypothetical protein PKA53_09065, partial [Sphingobacterium sp.]|nr:hypothetical protein [Sphingobacterium sp.]
MKSSFLFFLIVLGILQGTVACTKLVPPANEDPEPIEDEGATAIVNAPYTWGNLPVGGGGYVTGMVIHPVEENRMYIRTDVGGAYRWSEEEKKWIQLLEQHSTRVDGIALDLRLPDRVYIALNDGVYRSDNRGEEWTKLFSATYDGNGDLRWVGECIAVDPLNSDVIYTGTRKDGLYRSVDSGTSWSKIATVPSGTQGARAIVFGSTIQPQNQLSVVYVAVPTLGIYQSSDGGQTFSPLQDAPVYPNRMQYIAGKLYVTHDKGVAVWDGNGWTDITPAGGAGKNYCGLTVDLHDPNKIVVSQRYGTFNNPMYRSADGGQVWTQINTSSSSVIKDYNVPWWPDRWFSSATASLAFDPFHSGALYFTDWFGVTFTTDIWASGKVRFTTPLKGLEETVVLTLTAPSSGASVYSGLADIFGFCHENVQDYPAKRFYETNEGYSIAFCETAPQHIAILGASSNNGVGTTLMATTNDFGESWVSRALPAGAVLGRIAISATNPDKMVYVD